MTTVLDDAWFDRAVARIVKLMAALAAAGALAAFLWRGWTWAAGFLVGAAISWLSFRWFRMLTEALGGSGGRARGALFLSIRYLLVGGGAYLLFRYSSISVTAALVGLFVSTAAAIVEVLFELVSFRN